MTSGRKEFSLLELNACVRNTLQESLPERYWVRAEISEARIHPSGHCYLELIEKEEQSGKTVAKARATIWATTFRLLQPWFEQSTGQLFTSGIKILIQVSISFHELYGYNLTVHDIGYKIYTVLFPAAMQGDQTEQSIIHALDRINRHEELFDGVVIIRGGGATSDLNSFDSYPLAVNVAQFPLPVITGIGHERDDTVIDMVANTRVKTPTAAAEWIIARMHEADTYAVNLSHTVSSEVRSRIDREKQTIQRTTSSLPLLIERLILGEKHKTGLLTQQIKLALRAVIDSERNKLDHTEKTVRLLSPQSLLERGYSLTLHGNRIVKSVAELSPGDTIETIFADGKTTSRIEKTEPSKTK